MDIDVAGLVAQEWDVVVVGTGMGGATLIWAWRGPAVGFGGDVLGAHLAAQYLDSRRNAIIC